jgi:hypothetical protein
LDGLGSQEAGRVEVGVGADHAGEVVEELVVAVDVVEQVGVLLVEAADRRRRGVQQEQAVALRSA